MSFMLFVSRPKCGKAFHQYHHYHQHQDFVKTSTDQKEQDGYRGVSVMGRRCDMEVSIQATIAISPLCGQDYNLIHCKA